MGPLEIHLQQPDGGQVHAGERTERRSGAGMRKERKLPCVRLRDV